MLFVSGKKKKVRFVSKLLNKLFLFTLEKCVYSAFLHRMTIFKRTRVREEQQQMFNSFF